MHWLGHFLKTNPNFTLFISLALGYLVGRLRVGSIQLGGIVGTLIAAVILGQSGAKVDAGVKNVAFALFIFALGYMGGPQFFSHLNRAGLRFGVLSLIEMVSVIVLVLAVTGIFSLDVGTASGVLAGSATESAVIGTASESIGKLTGLTPAQVTTLQGNIGTAYSITYLFGLITIVLYTTQLAPRLLRIDLKQAAEEMWRKQRGDTLDAGQTPALPALVGRTYRVNDAGGQTVQVLERSLDGEATVEVVRRGTALLTPSPDLRLAHDDVVLVVGRRAPAIEAGRKIGPEVSGVPGLDVALESRDVVVTGKVFEGKSLAQINREHPDFANAYVTAISRVDQPLPAVPETVLHRGDEITIVGTRSAVSRIAAALGQAAAKKESTDYVYLGLGVALGIVIGLGSVKVGTVNLSLGTGGGCLLSGLLFGWLRARRPTFGAFAPAAAQTMKDLGLAVFIAITGLNAAPNFWPLLKRYGALLPIAGVCMVLIPGLISLFVGRRLLRIEPPVLIGAVAGQQCSTPAITAITGITGNSVPVLGYTITYAISNILLPITGPIVVGLIGTANL